MSLRDRLTGKQRRRVVVPVQITDPSEDRHILHGAMVALAQAEGRDTPEPAEIQALTEAVTAAEARLRAHTADVELLALGSVRWGEIEAEYVTPDGDTLDWKRALPEILAESCTDTDVQDADWWAERLADPAWSEGDVEALRLAVLHLNVRAPDPVVPKG